MKGDKHKPQSTFGRWIDAFMDGLKTPNKPHYRVPSLTNEKRYERRWRRRVEKDNLRKELILKRIKMDRKEIEEKITEITALQFGVELDEIQPNTSFVTDLNADSLDAVEVVMCIEDRFDITISDEEAEKMNTVGLAADFVEKVIAEKSD